MSYTIKIERGTKPGEQERGTAERDVIPCEAYRVDYRPDGSALVHLEGSPRAEVSVGYGSIGFVLNDKGAVVDLVRPRQQQQQNQPEAQFRKTSQQQKKEERHGQENPPRTAAAGN